MNKKGFTLVEVLIAGAIFVTTFACFGLLLKASINYVNKAGTKTRVLYQSRSEMERLRSISFDSLAASTSAETTITQVAEDLYLIRVGDLYTLRSKYQ